MMKMKRCALLIALAFLTQPLWGCIYLRLLEVKFQLSDFDKYLRLGDKEGLDLIFLKPVLLKEDILYLVRRGPTTIWESPESSIWQFYFQKRGEGKNRSEEEFDVPVDLFLKAKPSPWSDFREDSSKSSPGASSLNRLRRSVGAR
jgi:hypothetical protein